MMVLYQGSAAELTRRGRLVRGSRSDEVRSMRRARPAAASETPHFTYLPACWLPPALGAATKSIRSAARVRWLGVTSLTLPLADRRPPPALAAAMKSVPCAERARWLRGTSFTGLLPASTAELLLLRMLSVLRDAQKRNQSVGDKKKINQKRSRRDQARRRRRTSLTHNLLRRCFETSTIGCGLPYLPMRMPGSL